MTTLLLLPLLVIQGCSSFTLRPNIFLSTSSLFDILDERSARSRMKTEDNNEPDLFEYFDPLLSPHSYPNGIDPKNVPVKEQKERDASTSSLPTPLPETSFSSEKPKGESTSKKSFGFDLGSDGPSNAVSTKAGGPEFTTEPDFFDPTLSPHLYTSGTPDVIIGDEPIARKATSSKKVGVLLIDHGSRNPASNERLEKISSLYQEIWTGQGGIEAVVRASHMEIATPDIKQGLESLIDAGVDAIVCHPFFLSPGRHVKEDIPQLVDAAIESLGIEIPVETTDATGMNTEIMLGAIHDSVRRSTIVRNFE